MNDDREFESYLDRQYRPAPFANVWAADEDDIWLVEDIEDYEQHRAQNLLADAGLYDEQQRFVNLRGEKH